MKVFSLGMSDEGREMIVAAVADEATIARLDDYRAHAGAPGRSARISRRPSARGS